MIKHLNIGTRGSRLALQQTQWVADKIRGFDASVDLTVEIVKTTGDRSGDLPLSQIGGTGLFTKELEQALREKRIDLAVHSLKDLPTELPEDLLIGCVPDRTTPYDALVCKHWPNLQSLPEQATVGTSSPRRKAQLLGHRPDLRIMELRGNIDTRLRRVEEGTVDATILACAGLERLGLADAVAETLSTDIMVPAVAQGALAIEIREQDKELSRFLGGIADAAAAAEVFAERAFLAALGGGCHVPIGALARVNGQTMTLTGRVCRADGSDRLSGSLSGPCGTPEDVGQQLADQLLEQGARELIITEEL